VRRAKGAAKLLGDKAYDGNDLRQELKDRGIEPVIPGKSNRKRRIRFDKQAYKLRHGIENGICRLKDFRRIATRYDKLARNFLASIYLAAAIVWWIL
jgi:transposase